MKGHLWKETEDPGPPLETENSRPCIDKLIFQLRAVTILWVGHLERESSSQNLSQPMKWNIDEPLLSTLTELQVPTLYSDHGSELLSSQVDCRAAFIKT